MPEHLFAYGTLELPEVFSVITGQLANGVRARLDGYARYRLQGEVYPGIIAMPGESLQGTVYRDLDAATHKKIDHYEDTCYEKCRVTIVTEEGDELTAMAYVIPDDKARLLSAQRWDRQQFVEQYLDNFLRYIR